MPFIARISVTENLKKDCIIMIQYDCEKYT